MDEVQPAPAAKSGRAKVILIIVGVVLSVVAAGAGAVLGSRAPTPVLAAAPTPTSSPSYVMVITEPTPTPPPPFTGDLDTLILPIPGGAKVWQVDGITDGMSDIDRSATVWNNKNPQDIVLFLQRNHYQRGLTRTWVDRAGNAALIDLMQFKTKDDMYTWLVWAVRGLDGDGTANTGNIHEVDTGRWAEFVVGKNHQLLLVFGKGQFGVVMRVLADNQANLDLLTTLAIEQSGQLPG